MPQPGMELVRDLIARFFNGHMRLVVQGTHTGTLWGIAPSSGHPRTG